MSGLTMVSLKTYCTVFNTIGNQPAVKNICNEILGEKDGAWQSATQDLYRGAACDGMAHFPQYGDIPNEKGSIQRGIKQWYDFKYWNHLNDEPLNVMTRAIFLAGAFGLKEIPFMPENYSAAALGVFIEDLPLELIERLNVLYGECVSNGLEVCLKSKTAEEVVQLWEPVVQCLQTPHREEKKEDAEKHELFCRLDQLQNNFSFIESKVNDRTGFHGAVITYLNSLPESALTEKHYSITKYRGMVKLAIQTVYGDLSTPEEKGIPKTEKPQLELNDNFEKQNTRRQL